jgi:DNA-binding beta-propeller fold protein YncE
MFRFAAILVLCLSGAACFAGSRAYVLSAGYSGTTPGSITPFNTVKGSLGAAYFIPSSGSLIAVALGSRQVWDVVPAPITYATSILILDPASGSTLATIQLNAASATGLIFDTAGKFAYLSANDLSGNGAIFKIDVVSRSVVQSVSFVPSANAYPGGMAFSADGSRLYLAFQTEQVVVISTQSLETVGSIPIPFPLGGLFISGNTLLVTNYQQLFYFDAATLQQTNSVTVMDDSRVFGVSPDGTKIYLSAIDSIEILDFASGRQLASQTFVNMDLSNVSLSADGKRIVVASNPILLVDASTLATIKNVEAVDIPDSAAWLDATTVLMLNAPTGAMEVIDQSTATVTSTFPVGIGPVYGEVADPLGGVIYVGGPDGTPNVISTKKNRIVKNLRVTGGFAPAVRMGDQIFGTSNSGAAFYNLTTGATGYLPEPIVLGQNYFMQVELGDASPDGKTYWAPFYVNRLAGPDIAVPSSGIAIYDAATDSIKSRIVPPWGTGPLVFSPHSATAYIAGKNTIMLYDTRTLQNTATFYYGTTFVSLVISADGSVLYATDGGSLVYVLDAVTGAQMRVFTLPEKVIGLALSPDGTTIFLPASASNTVYMVNTSSGQATAVAVPYTPSNVVVVSK